MGLDMYMSADRFFSGEEYTDERSQLTYRTIATAAGLTQNEIDTLRRKSVTVSIGVGYWRKAHDIHGWFVDNVQDGNDNCAEYYVGRDTLGELRDSIKLVLSDPDEYSKEFTTNNDWDSDVEDVFRETLAWVEEWLPPKYDKFDFKYQASW